MILDTDIFNLIDDVQSIATATAKLADLSRYMQEGSDDLAEQQTPTIEQLRTLESYSSDVRRKCQALLVQAEEGAALSEQELKLLNDLLEN